MKSGFRDWSDIRVFLAVLRAGSTLAASRVLGMAQPTVARRIDALEHATGLTLFRRDTRGFHATDAARALLPLAEAIETAAGDFAARCGELARPAQKPIRITAGSPNFSARFAAIFGEFSRAHPGVRFEFLPSFQVLDLSAGEADIALRLTNTVTDPALICRRISTARFALYASRRYVEERGMPKAFDDVEGHDFVSLRVPGERLSRWLGERSGEERIVSTCGDVDALIAALRSGVGLGVLNVRHARDHPDLVRCSEPFPELETTQWLLVSPEAWARPEVKSFVRFFAPRYAAIFADDEAEDGEQRAW